ncbi:hypothetical protein OM076_11360 [Solirubrobacter ginsenosidimutans]|uniref:Uncharacterized protein n=1 Tax=Solirubrobacter ginsenosidimutans TaxID=490573 RepID=A0A9X3MQQ4_9ACTN|nr:hypothetical protein [Solirubrobacter ginsenosidimutans]MDA0160864.1 hypothetical protein [Solirubrobacter ginsenosidimutans]
MASVDLAGPGSAFEAHLAAQLAGPYTGALRRVELSRGEGGDYVVDWSPRHPVVLAALRRDLGEETVRIATTFLDTGTELGNATLAPWSERGGSVPLYSPALADGESVVPGFTLRLAVTLDDAPVVDLALDALLELHVLEGNLGRLMYAAGAEKQRVRRTLREVAAMRRLEHARRDALDRIGADAGVARFTDELIYDAESDQVLARQGSVEADADYARRIGLYRGFLMPTRGAVEALAPDTRFLEADNPFAVAVHLLNAGDGPERANLLEVIRRDRLLFPADDPAADALHAARALPAERREAILGLRNSVRTSFAFAADAGVAPALAAALDRAGRLFRALGITKVWDVTRAQDPGGGSRYELGLAVDVTPPTEEEAAQIFEGWFNDARQPTEDVPIEALIAGSGPPEADPDVRWAWQLCGLQTVHRTSSDALMLSHLPTQGLEITGADQAELRTDTPFEARFHAPGDPGTNALLAQALSDAAQEWAAAGHDEWHVLTDGQAREMWPGAITPAPGAPLTNVLGAAGLPVVGDVGAVVKALELLPDELVQTLALDATLAAKLTEGDPEAAQALHELVGLLRANHLAAVLPLPLPGDRLLLVVSVIGLPQAGINLNERRATGFRWYVVPLGGAAGTIKAVGSRTVLRPLKPGVVAVVVLGYVRTGLTDPYEVRVELGDDAVLSLGEYEFLMNLLGHICPIGVEINTFALRRDHVDLDGDGVPEPLRPALSRTFRTYQRRRARGTYDHIEE